MEKLIYLFDGVPAEGDDRYRTQFVDELAPDLLALGVERLGINVDDAASDVRSPVPTPHGETHHVAEVSFWLPVHDRRGEIEARLDELGVSYHGYLVSEALYTDYGDNEWAAARTWAPGERSPSVLTVCLIHRPEAMDPTAWVRHWHDIQSPVSAAIQPRARYVRNEVVRPITDGAPEIGGIVEEAWPSGNHIEDPDLFFNGFGDPDKVNENLTTMIESVAGFIDMDRMVNVTMSEYLFY